MLVPESSSMAAVSLVSMISMSCCSLEAIVECGLASSICELAKQGAKEGFETAFDAYASRWEGPVCGSVDRLSWVKAMQEGDEACCEYVLLA